VTNSGTGTRFIETKEYHRFKEFCDACRKYQYIGVCYGVPGVGKTLSARHYANWDTVSRYRQPQPRCGGTLEEVRGSTVVFYTPPVVVTSPGRLPNAIKELRTMLREILLEDIRKEEIPNLQAAQRQIDALHEPGTNGYNEPPEEVLRRKDIWWKAHEAFNERVRAQPDPTALIVIDEADRLKMTGLEQMRAIFDEGRIGMVLIGMPGLEKSLARYAQLYSRVGFVHEFKPLSQADVRQLLREGWSPSGISLPDEGLIDEDAIATLIRIAEGKFRLLHRLLQQIGRVMEINGLDKINREVVEAAREHLVIGTA
jgi:DNA transposition AAA+ family ATPase